MWECWLRNYSTWTADTERQQTEGAAHDDRTSKILEVAGFHGAHITVHHISALAFPQHVRALTKGFSASLSQPLRKSQTAKMVKLEEVLDEEFSKDQAGPVEDEWDTDSGMSLCGRELAGIVENRVLTRIAFQSPRHRPTTRTTSPKNLSPTESPLSRTLFLPSTASVFQAPSPPPLLGYRPV